MERPRVGPCEERSVRLWIEVVECVRERDAEAVVIVAPLQAALTPLPLHRVRLHPVDGSEAHLVQLALLRHAFDCKRASVAILDAPHAEIKPGSIVAYVRVRQAIAAHVASEVLVVRLGLHAA